MISFPNANVIDVFYDRHLRLWTALVKDEDDNQIGSASYGITKSDAIEDATFSQETGDMT